MRERGLRVVVLGLALLVAAATAVWGEPVDLLILHTNDIHGRIEIDEGLLGMPYISSLIQYYRGQYENVLVLDAGDTIHGRPITDRLDGESAVLAMNLAGYDVMVAGNHDFNFGYQQLVELEEEMMEFQLLSANVYKGDGPLLTPYVVKEVGDYTIGIFGLTTDSVSTHPDNVVGLEFRSAMDAARTYTALLRDEYNVDLVIALSHVGVHVSEPIAAQVEGIDLIVDGHSHTLLREGRWVGETLIVQAQEYSKYMGKVEINMSGERLVMEASLISAAAARELVDPDPDMIELLEEARDEIIRRMFGD